VISLVSKSKRNGSMKPQKGERVLIARSGAYGDIIHMSHLPRMLKDQGASFVGVSTGYKGMQLLKHNPFIDTIHYFEPAARTLAINYWEGRLKVLGQLYDRVVDLTGSLEMNCLMMENQMEYYQGIDIRKKLGEKNYYDISTEWAGYPELCGKYRGEIFYTDEEVKMVEHDLLREGRFKDNFKVLVNLGGSGPHKMFMQGREVAKRILEQFPEAVIFTTGTSEIEELNFTDLDENRVKTLVGKKPFRQALLMAKYMDLVIGCESGIMCGSSMWDVPTIQLLTATSKYCHTKYSTKDLSLQSQVKCSPCYRGPYKYYGCPKIKGSPACVYFDVDLIIAQVRKAYDTYFSKHLLSETA
jgi:ADP-heptose:LPS heptosyltransferase